MGFCRSCGLWFAAGRGVQWCQRLACQDHKEATARERHSAMQRVAYKKVYSNKANKLNGRHCQDCGKALKGDYWYFCPACWSGKDDYSLQVGVCL